MISAELADLISSPVMIVVSTADRHNRPSIGRSTGAWFEAQSGLVHMLVSATQWPDVMVDLEAGSPIAATFVNPQSYRSIQIKGRLQFVVEASASDSAVAVGYRDRVVEIMNQIGVSLGQLSHTMALQGLMHLTFMPTDVFNQTPGPQAGVRLRTGMRQ